MRKPGLDNLVWDHNHRTVKGPPYYSVEKRMQTIKGEMLEVGKVLDEKCDLIYIFYSYSCARTV